ncbi:GntR family transcriptional regulator [Microbacterium halophytorum]|uniref:GntR family transcriptional regulator n=1 Tax=Microbacterium halophytorum TaxID=2067568 RepID=UPI000CFBC845|nr:GntR family transcriptional regulator [Microbacterium halophytorum]
MDDGAEGAPVARTSLTDAAYAAIRARVLDRRIAPGSRLTVRPLSDELGLSATPIKAALGILAREGLITSELHRGFFVPVLHDRDVREIYQLREALDAMAAELAAADDAADGGLISLCEAQAGHLDRGEIDEFRRADVEFHRRIWLASGNSRILRAGEPFLDQMLLSNALSVRQPGRSRQSLAEHRAVVEAIADGDAARAAAVAREHIRHSCDAYFAALADNRG